MTTSTPDQVSHTPGPWAFEKSDSGDSSVGMGATPPVVFTTIPNDDRFRHIDIAVVGTTVYGNSEDGDPLSWGDPDANARLIAAAPELLEALRIADGAMNPPDLGGISLHDWNLRLKVATTHIRAAIAKAEGR